MIRSGEIQAVIFDLVGVQAARAAVARSFPPEHLGGAGSVKKRIGEVTVADRAG